MANVVPALLAVAPPARGRGLARALIEDGLTRSGRMGSPIYLETQNKANIPFYERFGFRLIETLPFRGDSDIKTYFMRKEGEGNHGGLHR
ncbi:MAG: GNAT family N-acetyltransferase [Spirochaetales bacterium]|nr:GNAT family N-acetyltransferase [Spirochaetales bacterium]